MTETAAAASPAPSSTPQPAAPQPAAPGSSAPGSTRIAYVANDLWAMHFLLGQLALAQRRGYALHYLGPGSSQYGRTVEMPGVAMHETTMSRKMSPTTDLRSILALRNHMRRLRPTIVDCQQSKAGLVGGVAARLAGVPVVVYVNHGTVFSSAGGGKKRVMGWAEWLSCKLADHAYTVSEGVRQVFIQGGLCPAERISILHKGGVGVEATTRWDPTNLEETVAETRTRLGIPVDAPLIGYVGRVTRIKGIKELSGAWALLRDRFPELRLMLVGPVDKLNPIDPEAMARLEQDPRVLFTGNVDHPVPLFRAMDMMVLPSYHEGLPATILEAAAMERPCVASRIPGNVDAIADGETGLLVPVHDEPALAEALARYIEDPALRQAHGVAGRERVLRDFRPEDRWIAMVDEYDRLLRAKGLTPPTPPAAEPTP